jgi:hypothetical protein
VEGGKFMKYVKRNGSLQDRAELEYLKSVVAEQQVLIDAVIGANEVKEEEAQEDGQVIAG